MGSGHVAYKKPVRYEPGPNDPALPPQLNEFKDKTTDEVLKELNRMPFFMTKLDPTDGEGGSNTELEALKALAYEGEPYEIAENFKNQGNDLYKVKRYKDAKITYTKGIDVQCDVQQINESLYANRAACELELKNFRSCINDCRIALKYNPKNIKCYYRIAKAYFCLDRIDDSRQTIHFALQLDSQNKTLRLLREAVERRDEQLQKKQYETEKRERYLENVQQLLKDSILLRNIKNISTRHPSQLLRDATIHLEDETDFESQLIYPAIVMYPTTNEFDFVATVGELTPVQDMIEVLTDRPIEWFNIKGHENFTSKQLQVYMETETGGLVKAGKKLTFHDILKRNTPKVPLFDYALKLYLVPKSDSQKWLETWDKKKALENRNFQ